MNESTVFIKVKNKFNGSDSRARLKWREPAKQTTAQ